MIESIVSFINPGDITPLEIMLFVMLFWFRSDLNKNTKSLNNGLVTKMEEVRGNVALLFSEVNDVKGDLATYEQASREICAEHRESMKELFRSTINNG